MREAVERGYTEPDPRDDLSGRDAARKGLILARLLGYRGAPPAPEDLVPRALRGRAARAVPDEARRSTTPGARAWPRGGPRPRAALRRDGDAARRCRAAGGGAARIARRRAQGTRNLISFTSRRYRAEPLVITGPGAGADVTAAGLLNDIQQLGSE